MPEAKLSFIDFCNILVKKNVTHLFDICGEQMCLFIAPSYLFVITGNDNIEQNKSKKLSFQCSFVLGLLLKSLKKVCRTFFLCLIFMREKVFSFFFSPHFRCERSGSSSSSSEKGAKNTRNTHSGKTAR